VVNFGLLASQSKKSSRKFSAVNYGLFILYVSMGFVLFSGEVSENGGLLLLLVFGIPVLVAFHFCYLFDRWHNRRKRGLETPSDND
jgi:hypothetical protein